MVLTADLSTVPGYSRCTRTWRDSGRSTGAEPDVVALQRDVGQPGLPGDGPQPGDREQVLHLHGNGAEPVGQLLADRRRCRARDSMAAIRV